MTTELPKLDGIAGAAFLLRTPARRTITLQHSDGVVSIREGGAYVTVQLSFSPSIDQLRAEAWRVVQEALDIRAVTRRDALATHRGEREYMLWTRAASGYELTFAETMDATWDVNIQVTVATARPAASPVAHPPLPHHPSFRFYRLSQLTDDLFDAYRNAYLALECLVSDESTKKKTESERAWLKRVLGGPLAPAIPGGMNINSTVDDIYQRGRLPLFHAKTGEVFYPPQDPAREQIQLSFGVLNTLLASLIRHKFGSSFSGGWAQKSQELIDAQARSSLQFDEVVYKTSVQAESVKPQVHIIQAPRRFGNLWATLEVAPPTALASITSFALRLNQQDRVEITFPESVPMGHVAAVRIELNSLDYNVRAPNPVHTM